MTGNMNWVNQPRDDLGRWASEGGRDLPDDPTARRLWLTSKTHMDGQTRNRRRRHTKLQRTCWRADCRTRHKGQRTTIRPRTCRETAHRAPDLTLVADLSRCRESTPGNLHMHPKGPTGRHGPLIRA